MRKALTILLATTLAVLLAVDTSEACNRKKKKPPKPKCPSDTEGTMNSVGGGSASVTFAPKSGGQLYASPSAGMPLSSGQRCACAVAVKKNLGVSAAGVTFPNSYPGFSASTSNARIASAGQFVSHFLGDAGKNPADYDVYLFETGTGGTVPAGVDFNLEVDFNIPVNSNGSELTQDIVTLAMFLFDGDTAELEPNGDGDPPIDYATYSARGYDDTDANIFKAGVSDGSGLRITPTQARQLANGVCLNGGFDCDMNRNGLVDPSDLNYLLGDAAVATTTECAKTVPTQPTEPTGPTTFPTIPSTNTN
jgi:hypothetical protein